MLNRDYLEKVEELVRQATGPQEIEGVPMAPVGWQDARPPEYLPDTLKLASLDSLGDYLATKEGEEVSLLHVVNAGKVEALGPLTATRRKRPVYACAIGTSFEHQLTGGQEDIVVWLQTHFEDSERRAQVMKLIGTLTDQEIRTSVDDGVSQEVGVKAGAFGRQAEVQVENPVLLVPVAPFAEVAATPEEFILRIHRGPRISMIPVFSGLWERNQRTQVTEYVKQLAGDVPVIG